jgi:predicted phage-related endonuclease
MPAVVLAKITHDSDYDSWREARRCHDGTFRIGSSDAPVIVLGEQFGRVPLDLWMEKMGHADGPEENFDMRQGHLLENVCATEAALELERNLHRRHAILMHSEHPWMIADVDRVISRLNGPASNVMTWHKRQFRGPGILECKAPRYGGMITVKEEGPAKSTVVQVLHQIVVTGWKWAVCAYYHRDFGVLLYPITRAGNEETIAEIIRREQAFWECLQANELPPDTEEPPEIRIPEAFRDATAWRDDPIWQAAFKRLAYAKDRKAVAEGIHQTAREDFEFLMGDMQEVQSPWGKVSWKFSKPGKRLNKKKLQANLNLLSDKLKDAVAEGDTVKAMMLTEEVAAALESAHSPTAPTRSFYPTIY